MVEYHVTTTEHPEGDARDGLDLYAAHAYAEELVCAGFQPAIECYRDGSTQVLTWQGLSALVGE